MKDTAERLLREALEVIEALEDDGNVNVMQEFKERIRAYLSSSESKETRITTYGASGGPTAIEFQGKDTIFEIANPTGKPVVITDVGKDANIRVSAYPDPKGQGSIKFQTIELSAPPTSLPEEPDKAENDTRSGYREAFLRYVRYSEILRSLLAQREERIRELEGAWGLKEIERHKTEKRAERAEAELERMKK